MTRCGTLSVMSGAGAGESSVRGAVGSTVEAAARVCNDPAPVASGLAA